ncbi:tautomerase family protein [Arthrobacter sp. efr-133-TYG-118]|uniref:tautomerase family protein n=1 Tax=Arthrobacter sp. efr-133-TYG-118 TaxID=3040279 RepID=UPI00254B2537|nr:tautomerase family protein [Arthrobacter sp. efr-133-TYG-118]
MSTSENESHESAVQNNRQMPLIQVLNASPASTARKRELLAALTSTYAEVMRIRPDTIRVVLQEVPRENWSVAGVTLADSGEDEAV